MAQQRDLQVLRLLGASRIDSEIDEELREMHEDRPDHTPHSLLIADAIRAAIIPDGTGHGALQWASAVRRRGYRTLRDLERCLSIAMPSHFSVRTLTM